MDLSLVRGVLAGGLHRELVVAGGSEAHALTTVESGEQNVCVEAPEEVLAENGKRLSNCEHRGEDNGRTSKRRTRCWGGGGR